MTLSISTLVRDGMVSELASDTVGWCGTLRWTNSYTGERVASVGYVFERRSGDYILTLNYTVTRADGTKHSVDMRVQLQTTRPQFGGTRWWFRCPLAVNNTPCLRRVGKLYVPPGRLHYGCRHCYDLTYTSCQESHKYDRLFGQIARELGCAPELVKELLRDRR